jgi:hypothetical protein
MKLVQCRYCGVEIADNALICFRCGHATTEPRIKPPDSRRRSGAFRPSVLALFVLVLAAVFLGVVTPDETPKIMSWVVAALAAVLLVWRLVRFRRR